MNFLAFQRTGRVLLWIGPSVAILVPLALAAQSPLLAWREPVYIVAGFAGIAGLAVIFLQPLLAAGYLPGLSKWRTRYLHRIFGAGLLVAVVIHVAGLWLTSPPDMVDALLFRSPTRFSAWGVLAMWAVIASVVLAWLRRRHGLRFRIWRGLHMACAVVIVAGTVLHALMIEGTMEPVSKWLLCAAVTLVAGRVVGQRLLWSYRSWKQA